MARFRKSLEFGLSLPLEFRRQPAELEVNGDLRPQPGIGEQVVCTIKPHRLKPELQR